jgi:protein-S-isoprenylcysteine O-methyltransferase Ste14
MMAPAMGNVLLVLLLGNFALIGSLPVICFRRDGRLNARWFLTGAPFFVAPLLLVLGRVSWLHPLLAGRATLQLALSGAAAVLAAASIVLIVATMEAHRVRPALWHQDDDAPAELVTRGPYARIRHPFYSSFLLTFVAACLALPHAATLACLLYAAAALTVTARREERGLSDSAFGDDYRRYLGESGRFLPRLRA